MSELRCPLCDAEATFHWLLWRDDEEVLVCSACRKTLTLVELTEANTPLVDAPESVRVETSEVIQ